MKSSTKTALLTAAILSQSQLSLHAVDIVFENYFSTVTSWADLGTAGAVRSIERSTPFPASFSTSAVGVSSSSGGDWSYSRARDEIVFVGTDIVTTASGGGPYANTGVSFELIVGEPVTYTVTGTFSGNNLGSTVSHLFSISDRNQGNAILASESDSTVNAGAFTYEFDGEQTTGTLPAGRYNFRYSTTVFNGTGTADMSLTLSAVTPGPQTGIGLAIDGSIVSANATDGETFNPTNTGFPYDLTAIGPGDGVVETSARTIVSYTNVSDVHTFTYTGNTVTPVAGAYSSLSLIFTVFEPVYYELEGTYVGGPSSGNSSMSVIIEDRNVPWPFVDVVDHWTQTYSSSFDYVLQSPVPGQPLPYRIADGPLSGQLPPGTYRFVAGIGFNQGSGAGSTSDGNVVLRIGAAAPLDTDGDGVPDDDDAFPDDPTEWADADEDGVGDNSDAFPDNPSEWEDSDGDGVGDNSDVFPYDPDESSDSDGDGTGDNQDEFPNSNTDPIIDLGRIQIDNVQLENGSYLADEIEFAIESQTATEDFVVDLQEWRDGGHITGREMGQILREVNLN